MIDFLKRCQVVLLFSGLMATAGQAAVAPAGDSLKLITQKGHLPQVPVLVRVEVLNPQGLRDWSLWDADATLSVDVPGVTLSTNRVLLRNGMGSALVAFAGGGDFNLTATVGGLQATRPLVTLTNAPVTTVGGTNTSSNTVWSGVVRVTNDVTVPAGFTLTILSNTLVLIDGVTSGTAANDLLIYGTINSFGTEDQPVTITCGNPSLAYRWGQIRHEGGTLATAPPSTYRYTIITRAGRALGEGHTGQAPVIRPNNAKVLFEHCSLTDHEENVSRGAPGFGTPGKIGFANNSELTFNDCLLQRARSGPEIQGTALLLTNSYLMDMLGPDDSDGIYIHAQSAGQMCALKNSVMAAGDDDGIDTLDSTVTVENCIIRGWNNLFEDAKGISVFNGATSVRRSLIVDSTVGISAKTTGSVRVNIHESTLYGNLTNVLAQKKSSAPGPNVDYRITNSVLWGATDAVASDFAQTNLTIGYCNISEPWPGTGNIMSDPLFVNSAGYDFHLLPHSPSIDAGDPLAAKDPDGSPIDQGRYTFVPPAPIVNSPAVPPSGAFEFLLKAYTNRNYVIESSDTATNWNFLKTISALVETTPVSDPTATNSPHRYYRARLAP